MRQLTYYPAPVTDPDPGAWQPAPDDIHTLRFGYNLADVDRLARMSHGRAASAHPDPRGPAAQSETSGLARIPAGCQDIRCRRLPLFRGVRTRLGKRIPSQAARMAPKVACGKGAVVPP
jgi:hypothetical protein